MIDISTDASESSSFKLLLHRQIIGSQGMRVPYLMKRPLNRSLFDVRLEDAKTDGICNIPIN